MFNHCESLQLKSALDLLCWPTIRTSLSCAVRTQILMTSGKGRFRLDLDLNSRDRFIRGDEFLASCRDVSGATYLKRDFLFRSGYWRGVHQMSLLRQIANAQGKVLVIGHSDIATSRMISTLLVKGLGARMVFGVNTRPNPGVAETIPLGLTNLTLESALHQILGKDEHMFTASTEPFPQVFRPNIYSNFTAGTNSKARRALLVSLAKLPGQIKVFSEEPVFTDQGRVNYLRRLRSSTFVVCPEGNGKDTHRLWETLYMGGVPIVKRDKYMAGLYDRLPVLQVSNWSELGNLAFIESEWHRITSMTWDKALLGQEYWSKIIESRIRVQPN